MKHLAHNVKSVDNEHIVTYVFVMPKTKKKPPAGSETVTVRLNPDEVVAIDAELASVKKATGLTITRGAYAKHAVLEHRRLRKIEVKLREVMSSSFIEKAGDFARNILEEGQ